MAQQCEAEVEYDGPWIEQRIEWKLPDYLVHGSNTVELFGSWNRFKGGDQLQYQDKQLFACNVKLPLGTHVYRFLINGEEWDTCTSTPKNYRNGIGYNQIHVTEKVMMEKKNKSNDPPNYVRNELLDDDFDQHFTAEGDTNETNNQAIPVVTDNEQNYYDIKEEKEKENAEYKQMDEEIRILKSISRLNDKTCKRILEKSNHNLRQAIEHFYIAKFKTEEYINNRMKKKDNINADNKSKKTVKRKWWQSKKEESRKDNYNPFDSIWGMNDTIISLNERLEEMQTENDQLKKEQKAMNIMIENLQKENNQIKQLSAANNEKNNEIEGDVPRITYM